MECSDDTEVLMRVSLVKNCYLQIAVTLTNTVSWYYTSIYNIDELKQLNEGFSAYSDISEVYKTLNDYFDTHKPNTNITINIDNINNTLCITCKDVFINTLHNEVSFTLQLSLSHIVTIQHKKHFIIKANDVIPLQYAFTVNDTLRYHILLHMMSCVMFVMFCVLFVKLCSNVDSFILSKGDFELLSQWIQPNRRLSYKLLYRATRDGDSADDFHRCCDRRGKTLTVILTDKANVIGGYADVEWDSSEKRKQWKYKESENAFLFNMKNKKKYTLRNDYKDRAVFVCGEDGPTFGFGHDLHVVDKCLSKPSSCNTPLSYVGMETRNEINGGERDFIVKEVEVFLVNNVNY